MWPEYGAGMRDLEIVRFIRRTDVTPLIHGKTAADFIDCGKGVAAFGCGRSGGNSRVPGLAVHNQGAARD